MLLISVSGLRADDREGLVTGLEGEKFTVDFQMGNHLQTFQGAWQDEYEYRINLPSAESADEEMLRLLRIYYPDQYSAFRHLDFGERSTSPVYLAPLGSRLELYHDTVTHPSMGFSPISQVEVGDTRSQSFTKEIMGRILHPRNQENDRLVPKFYVGDQYETSSYFDDTAETLKGRGIAVRLKSWYPSEQAKAQGLVPAAKSLFIKINRVGEGEFTKRQEFHIKLPPNFREAQVDALVRELSKKVVPELKGMKLGKLERRQEVKTKRNGINLMWKDPNGPKDIPPRKIGFATFDRFTVQDIEKGKTTPRLNQIELEIFPGEVGLLKDPRTRQQIESFLADVRTHTRGIPMPTPKFRHCEESFAQLSLTFF